MPAPIDTPPAWRARVGDLLVDPGRWQALRDARITDAADDADAYRPWRDFRHHRPLPEGCAPEDAWALVKLQREAAGRRLPLLLDKAGRPFSVCRTDPLIASLHRIDTKETLWRSLPRSGAGPDADVSYRLMAAIEEAHHSSAIEGAVTTRRQSREMLRSGRDPRDRSERMILNTFRAVQRLDEWIEQPLTPERIVQIQAVVTDGTLDDPADVGRFRTEDDIHIVDALTGDSVFVPPPAAQLAERVGRLCEFANAKDSDLAFVHPVVRAILVHHQLAYDHPFADGNGRTARALFMWSILRAGYRWFRALSISRTVHAARDAYYRAFRDVQDDESDVTYFVRQQLRCIEREIDHLARFLEKRANLERWLSEKKSISASLNARQIALVDHALSHVDAVFTAREHAGYHGVTQPTAWKDLTSLVEMKLLDARPQGRRILYTPSAKLRRLAVERPAGPAA